MTVAAALQTGSLPVGGVGRKGVGWWGVIALITTEAALFAYLLFSYFYFAVQLPPGWSPEPHPSMTLSGPNTVVLLLSSVAVWWSERGVLKGNRGQNLAGLAVGIVLGIIFLAIQYFEWRSKSFTIRSGPYGSLFFTITGFHMVHVLVGVIALSFTLLWSALGYFDRVRNGPVLITAVYWHFVDAVWLCVFTTFYLTPYLLPS